MHMNTHTRTHTYTVLIPFTRLNTGKSSRKTCKWVMNFTVPEHAGSDKTREMTFAALLCDSIHQLLTLIFPILLWFPLKDRKKSDMLNKSNIGICGQYFTYFLITESSYYAWPKVSNDQVNVCRNNPSKLKSAQFSLFLIILYSPTWAMNKNRLTLLKPSVYKW